MNSSPKPCSACESFLIMLRVIWALILREMITSFGRHNIGFAWMFVEPMLFTIGVTILWELAGLHKNGTVPVPAFALTGYSCILLWRSMPGKTEAAVRMNMPLLYHRNVRILDIFLARLILHAGGCGISFIVLGIFFTWVGWIEPPENPLLVVVGWLMMAYFGISLALLIGALNAKWHWVEKVWHPAAYIFVPLSGALFLVDNLGPRFQHIVTYIPTVSGSEAIRAGYFGSKFNAHYDLFYMGMWSTILLLVSLLLI